MTTRTDDDRSTPWLALLVGALIAVIVAIGYLIYSGAANTRSIRLAASMPDPSQTLRPQVDTTPAVGAAAAATGPHVGTPPLPKPAQ